MSVSIANPFRTDIKNWTDHTIQPTIIHFKKANGPVHSDRNHFLMGILNSGIDVPRYGRNIDKCTRMNPQGPIMTTIPKSNGAKNCNIFDSVSRPSYLSYMGSTWHRTIKSES